MRITKACIICDTNPALGVGGGKMKSTCHDCVTSLIADKICPVCRGVDAYTSEHFTVCDGKLPKKPKGSHLAKTNNALAKTVHQVGVEDVANKQSESRRVRMLTVEEAVNLVSDLEARLKSAHENGLTEKRVVVLNKKLSDARLKLKAAKLVPVNRCDECNCFLSDRGNCVNEECVPLNAS